MPRRGVRGWQRSNLDRSEGDFAAVFLEADVAASGVAVLRIGFPFPADAAGFPVGTVEFVFDDLFSIEPMLDVPAIHDQPGLIPLSDRLGGM